MSKIRPEVLAEAARWFAQLQAPGLDAGAQARWQAWKAASPLHAQAWQEVEAVWGSFQPLPVNVAQATFEGLARRRRRVLKRGAGAVLGLGGLAVLGWTAQREQWSADLRTSVAELGDWPLADGSRLWLNAQSAADLDMAPGRRQVWLRRGELLLNSGPDRQALGQPLQVDCAQGRLQTQGACFSLRLRAGGSALLSVFEGLVALQAWHGAPRAVAAGQSLSFDAQGAGALEPAGLLREAWRRGLLVAERMRLDDFLAELSPHHPGWLDCDPELAGLRLVGTYSLRDSAAALDALCLALPVRLNRRLPAWTRVVARA